MKSKILISFLIAALLTAGNPAPEFITNNTTSAQISRTTAGSIMTSEAQSYNGCMAPNGLGKRTAPFKIEVFGKKKADVYLSGTSKNGNYSIHCELTVKQGQPVTIDLPWGDFVYLVIRDSMIRRGSFFINQSDKATMQVLKDKVRIGPFE